MTDAAAVGKALERSKASAVIHLAGLTDTKGVDHAVFERVNVQGTLNVMGAAQKMGLGFVFTSTDYVFTLEKEGPFSEDQRPLSPPPGAYAASKFQAERWVLDNGNPKALVARIAFPYGASARRTGLSDKMVGWFKAAREKKTKVPLFSDQHVTPSYIPDVVKGLMLLAARAAAGSQQRTFHLVGAATTPLEFGLLVRKIFGFEDVAVEEASVKGTVYAADLRLSTAATEAALSWRHRSHEEALRAMEERRP